MPPKVGVDKRGYFYHDQTEKLWLALVNGRDVRLKPDARKSDVWAAYDALDKQRAFTVAKLVKLYIKSVHFNSLKPATQKSYISSSKEILDIFGDMKPDNVTPGHVQKFMDYRSDKKSSANHEKTFLSVVMNWGRARNHVTIPNPCEPVKRFKTGKGGRYVEDHEYKAFYDFCKTHPMIQAAMEIAYLCGSRQQDVLRLKKVDDGQEGACYLTERGLVIYQEKTGKVQLKLYTPRLVAALNLAKLSPSHKTGIYMIRTLSGNRYTTSGFNSIWKRLIKKAIDKGVISGGFRFHDLKVKGISDYSQGDKQSFSGHKTSSMMERYNRTIDETETVNKPMDE